MALWTPTHGGSSRPRRYAVAGGEEARPRKAEARRPCEDAPDEWSALGIGMEQRAPVTNVTANSRLDFGGRQLTLDKKKFADELPIRNSALRKSLIADPVGRTRASSRTTLSPGDRSGQR